VIYYYYYFLFCCYFSLSFQVFQRVCNIGIGSLKWRGLHKRHLLSAGGLFVIHSHEPALPNRKNQHNNSQRRFRNASHFFSSSSPLFFPYYFLYLLLFIQKEERNGMK